MSDLVSQRETLDHKIETCRDDDQLLIGTPESRDRTVIHVPWNLWYAFDV